MDNEWKFGDIAENEELEFEEEEGVKLGFIRLIGEETDGYYRYEFIFTNNIDEFWCENGEYKPCCLVNDLAPKDEYITEIHIVKMKIKLDLIQNNCCFGFQDCTDGIIALAWANDLDECLLFFNFGDEYDVVEKKLAENSVLLG